MVHFPTPATQVFYLKNEPHLSRVGKSQAIELQEY